MNRNSMMAIDIKSIKQMIKKKMISLIMIALLAGSISYIVDDGFMPKKYAGTVVFSVTSDNTYYMTNSYQMRTALERMEKYINSSAMNTALCELIGTEQDEFPGNLKVERLMNSNLIEVKCRANSAEDVFRICGALRKHAPQILDQMTESFQVIVLGRNDIDNIKEDSKSPLIVSVLIAGIVWFLGLFCLISAHVFSGKIQNRRQAEKALDFHLIGTIPHENSNKRHDMLVTSELCSMDYAEDYQRAALSFIRKMNKENRKVCVVTSLFENEGKSTVSANLSLSLAKNKKNVLLIDADFRKPALYKIFNMPNPKSFSEVLSGGTDSSDMIVRIPQTDLYCCFSSPTKENADELIEQPKFGLFVKRMREYFDYVIIDTSPAGITDDAKHLCKYADTALFVVRTNTAKTDDINDMTDQFENEGVPICGMILNDCHEVNHHAGKYKYGYYHPYADNHHRTQEKPEKRHQD